MKAKYQLLLLILIATTCVLRSQSIYVEFAGRGLFYSINYEHNFSGEISGWRGQVGMGYLPTSLISIPVSASYVFGKGSNHLELGGGATYFEGYIWGDDDKFNPSINVLATCYYRYQKPNGKFYFKLGVTPTFLEIPLPQRIRFVAVPWAGIGIGYKF
jgi:hypothetical protein